MIKLINPWHLMSSEAAATLHAPAVRTWLQGQPGNRIITLAELRAGLPALAAALTRPVVNQICADLDIGIENPDDSQA